MPAGRYTSRVFVIGEALRTALAAKTYPAFQGRVPVVTMGAVDPDQDREQIGVNLNPDDSLNEWVNLGPAGRDEAVVFDVVHLLMNPNIKTPDEVWQRLEAVADIIQSVTYDTVTETVTALGYSGEIREGRARSVRPQVGPGEHGYVGSCVVSFEFRSRI
jgi:hypothetical protein